MRVNSLYVFVSLSLVMTSCMNSSASLQMRVVSVSYNAQSEEAVITLEYSGNGLFNIATVERAYGRLRLVSASFIEANEGRKEGGSIALKGGVAVNIPCESFETLRLLVNAQDDFQFRRSAALCLAEFGSGQDVHRWYLVVDDGDLLTEIYGDVGRDGR